MPNPKVCVCIPCYNNESTIGDTLKSIINQTYGNLAIKVFDNASSDETREVVLSFVGCGREIELYTRESNVAGEENFNSCILAAEGEYAAIFHSDDIYEPSIIAEQVEFLNRSNCLAVSTHASLIDENGNVIGQRIVPSELSCVQHAKLDRERLIELSFKYGNIITCPSVLFRTDVLKNHIKKFHGDRFKSSADLNVWFRITEKGAFGFINKTLMRYRVSASSFSFNLARERIQDHDLFLVLDDFIENCDFTENRCKKLARYRNFLLMKDRVNTNLNRLILGRKDYQSIDLTKNILLFFSSKFHAKYCVIACSTKLIILLPGIKYLSGLIRKIKFDNI